jgi:hypothetical protein
LKGPRRAVAARLLAVDRIGGIGDL